MDRETAAGIPRSSFLWALSRPDIVQQYRKINLCMLCRREGVNAAGICDNCYHVLNSPEIDAVQRWLSGVGP
ncbi:MAG: hypothetical protein JNM85_05385 [Chthonomonas sp.]|nr:hypothetical protein [Chthonomonas sp.]